MTIMLPQALAIPALLLLISIFILSSLLLHPKKHHQQQQQHGDAKNPPGPKPLPIIGNLHMLGKLPHRTLQSLSNKYGPIMSLKLGQVPAIVVSSPEAAELFLKTHDSIFASRPKLQSVEIFTYGRKGLVFSEYGGYWRNVRKLCTLQLLSTSKVEIFAPLRKHELDLLVKSLKESAMSCEDVDVSELVGELVENITYKMILGRSKDDRFEIKGPIQEVMKLVGAFNLADYVPFLGVFDIQGLTRRSKRALKALDRVFEQIIKGHELHPYDDDDTGESPNYPRHKDFVDILLSLMHQPMDPQDEHNKHMVERTNIKAILLDLIAGAYDTSTTAIEWGMSELLINPRVMKKLQDEIKNVVGMDRKVDEKDLENLHYLDMVVKETMRLHPVVPLLVPHESLKDITIDGYYIERKTRIIINTWAIGKDPKVWSDNVDVFFPERFEDNDVDIRGRDFRLLPFGSGRRGCPGMHMGINTVRLVMAQLVHCFNWELPLGMDPQDLDMSEEFGLSVPRSKHLLARPTYRLLN